MKTTGCFLIIGMILCGLVFQGCGSAKSLHLDPSVEAGKPPPQPPVVGRPYLSGPRLEISYVLRADVLHLAEKASLWHRELSPKTLQVLDNRVGLESEEREALRRFAIMRAELEDRTIQHKPPPSFSDPFGLEGLFPLSSASVVDRFWGNILDAKYADQVGSALQGLMKPADAKIVELLISLLTPRLQELRNHDESGVKHARGLSQLLRREDAGLLLEGFGRFLGVPTRNLAFAVHPVWMPDTVDLEAVAYGNRILVTVSDKEQVGVEQAALVVHEVGRRWLSLLKDEKKASYTRRFVERTGFDRKTFYLVEGILDAFSYGVFAPLLMQDTKVSLSWPGDVGRQQYSQALVPLLRRYLHENRSLDAGFVNRAADLCHKLLPPKPADFLEGAMVIGQEQAIQAFKSQVVRWTVWKFLLSKKYDYSRKLADNPGKTVLLLATPPDLGILRSRLEGIAMLNRTLKRASDHLLKNKMVFVALARPYRGYVFLLAAPSAQGMKKLARAFFSLKKMPSRPMVLE